MSPKRPAVYTDPFGIPKAIFGDVGNALQGAADWLNRVQGRSAKAEMGPSPLQGDPTGRYAPPFMQQQWQDPPPRQLPGPTAIVQGTRDGVTADRTQSDEYKAKMAQYESLQKQKKFEEATTLGREIWKEKYKDTLAKQQKTENPLMREMFPERYGEPTLGPTSATLQADPALKGVTTFFPGAEPNSFSTGVGNPVPPTVIFNQGAMMDANRGVENLQAWQKLKTNEMNFASQQPSGVLEGIGERVRSYLADKANTGQFLYGKQD